MTQTVLTTIKSKVSNHKAFIVIVIARLQTVFDNFKWTAINIIIFIKNQSALLFFLCNTSSGKGKTMVEFFSAAM